MTLTSNNILDSTDKSSMHNKKQTDANLSQTMEKKKILGRFYALQDALEEDPTTV